MQNDKANTRTTLNDRPETNIATISDLYGGFINHVVCEVRDAVPPKTMAITGEWGSGKTSVLAAVYKSLIGKSPPFVQTVSTEQSKGKSTEQSEGKSIEQSEGNVGIWFEAWRFQHEAQPVIALLHTIKEEFSLLAKTRESGGKLFHIATLGALGLIDSAVKTVTAGVDPHLRDIPKTAEKYEKDNILVPLATNQIQRALQDAVETVLNPEEEENHNRKLIIFIDDLDRCTRQKAHKLLEGIKIYLDIPNCVTLMAVDQGELEKTVTKEHDEIDNFYAATYLEKLCQDAHRIPPVSEAKSAKFVQKKLDSLLNDYSTPLKPEQKENLKSLISNIVKYLPGTLPANPRRIKMVINRLAAHLHCHPLTEKPSETIALEAKAIIFLACIQVSYRKIYESLMWDIEFMMTIFDFATDDNYDSVGEESSAMAPFAGLKRPSAKDPVKGSSPSHLQIFRPIILIQQIQEQEPENIEIFKALLKTLIDRYNGFE